MEEHNEVRSNSLVIIQSAGLAESSFSQDVTVFDFEKYIVYIYENVLSKVIAPHAPEAEAWGAETTLPRSKDARVL